MNDRNESLDILLSQIKFPFVRSKIRREFYYHISDLKENLVSEGLPKEVAEIEAIQAMGDPVEIGYQLNAIHRPAIEWMYFISKVSFIFLFLAFTVTVFFGISNVINSKSHIPKVSLRSRIDELDVVEHKKIDDTHYLGNTKYHFTDLVYLESDHVLLFFDVSKISVSSLSLELFPGTHHIFYNIDSTWLEAGATQFMKCIPDSGFHKGMEQFGYGCSEGYDLQFFLKLSDVEAMPQSIRIALETYDGTQRTFDIKGKGE